MILSLDKKSIDVAKTKLLLQNSFRSGSNLVGRWSYNLYDVYFYKESVFFDKWDYDERTILYVFQTKGGMTRELCKFKYLN